LYNKKRFYFCYFKAMIKLSKNGLVSHKDNTKSVR
jgi:hypothetical protein